MNCFWLVQFVVEPASVGLGEAGPCEATGDAKAVAWPEQLELIDLDHGPSRFGDSRVVETVSLASCWNDLEAPALNG